MRSRFKHFKTFCALVVFAFVVVGCQPNTRQDRATVGPEQTPTAPSNADTPSTEVTPSSQDGAVVGAIAKDWEATQKSLCDAGKPSGCSALAYDAVRAQQISVATRLFTRACLLDESVGQCPQTGQQSVGLARSCFEAARLHEQQGRSDDARSFRVCACARGYKPACAANL